MLIMKIQPIVGVYKVKFNYSKYDLVDHSGIGVVIWSKTDPDKVLMQFHNKFDFWTLPLGKVDKGETIRSTTEREMFEELGIHVLDFKVLKTFKLQRKPNNILITITGYLVEISSYTGIPYNKEPHKHRELKWMSINELKELKETSGATRYLIKYIDEISQ